METSIIIRPMRHLPSANIDRHQLTRAPAAYKANPHAYDRRGIAGDGDDLQGGELELAATRPPDKAEGRAAESKPSMPVWFWTASLVCDAKIAEVLSEDERRRAQRYAFLRDRVRFIAARSFLRRTLGRHRGVDPASLRFAYGLRGRPELEGAPALQFNLSYSGDQALLAVSRDGPLGVDVEARRPLPDLEGLASQVMDPVELRAFHAHPEQDRSAAFFALWTRKEAALKAMGVGFSIDPRSFHVGVAGELTICIREAPCRILGSGLIDQSQKTTTAARQIAEK